MADNDKAVAAAQRALAAQEAQVGRTQQELNNHHTPQSGEPVAPIDATALNAAVNTVANAGATLEKMEMDVRVHGGDPTDVDTTGLQAATEGLLGTMREKRGDTPTTPAEQAAMAKATAALGRATKSAETTADLLAKSLAEPSPGEAIPPVVTGTCLRADGVAAESGKALGLVQGTAAATNSQIPEEAIVKLGQAMGKLEGVVDERCVAKPAAPPAPKP